MVPLPFRPARLPLGRLRSPWLKICPLRPFHPLVPNASDSGAFPVAARIDSETMYKIGMLVQLIEDAGPAGMTLAQLGARTQLGAPELDRALRICLKRGYVGRDGERYKTKR